MDLDIIELGSSDEETRPPPAKKVKAKNAMVHIPTKLHEVTIKPVAAKPTELSKLGKNITITKTKSPGSLPSAKVKPPDKTIQRIFAAKKKTPVKKSNRECSISKDKIFNPLSYLKKGLVQPVGNSTSTVLKNPIQIKKTQLNRPQSLQRLPPSITIKKTAMKPVINVLAIPKPGTKPVPNAIPIAKLNKKRKIVALQTVDLDDEEASTSSNSPQWYVRPEQQTEKNITAAENTASQDNATTSPQDANNKEPDGPKYIEITIEDSPIKPPKAKRTRELSVERVITIDDSPNKGTLVSDDVAEGSDQETDTTRKEKRKVPHSKKKLNYPGLKRIEETQTLEIEFEPVEPVQVEKPNVKENQEGKIISLTPDIMEEEQASVEIAQNKEGDVSVVQIKPLPPKQDEVEKEALQKVPAMKSEFHPIYQSFISLCIELENSNDMEKIIEKKIKTYYRQVPKEYRESDEFLDMVSSKIVAMRAAPEKMYLFIKDIVDELNLQRKVLKYIATNEDNAKDQDSFLYGREKELDPNKQRQIRKLEKTLKKLNRAIQKLENQEVDFDDEEDSVYLLTEKYKERMVRVHAKFCQLTSTKMPSQPRLIIDPRPGLSPAPAKRLEAWINKKDSLVFPDFHDVLRCVRDANEEDGLGWSEACIMEEARDLFMRCGRKIQRRRQENEWRLATSRITDITSDPAEQSEELKKRLEANRRLANTKETEVFDKYCDRQSMLKLEAEEIDDKDAEESPVESEEEDNDESSSLESKQRRKERLKRLLQEQSKKVTHKAPQPEEIENREEIEIVIESVQSIDENESEAVNEADKIETPRDDNDIGSDMDELHLLQKLHSDSEIHSVSTSESSGSETPIAISDTLDSNSDDEKLTKTQPSGIISIENSSYSDDSDSQKSNKIKDNKKYTTANKELMDKDQVIECASSSVKDCTVDVEIENTIISSSDGESNPDDNANSIVSDNSSKISSVKEGQDEPNKDEEHESEEIFIEINDCEKPSDGEDDSINSEIIANDNFEIRSSSTSSGQFEELLKEHNSDPLLKRPELIPSDPTDKLFDSLVMKHFNDPLVKKHLPGSDSSNGGDAENSSSDTQSSNAHETVEEVKKDLIETSVDTEDLNLSNSPLNIVDKFIEKINKQSEGSPSSDEEKLLMKVDEELDLITDIRSPVTCALDKEITLARQTRAWPRFKDECSSLSSAEDENTGDNSQSMSAKTNGSINGDNDGIEIEQNQNATETNSTNTWNFEKVNESSEPKACSSKSTDQVSKWMDTVHSKNNDSPTCEDMDVDSIETVSNMEPKVSGTGIAAGVNVCEEMDTDENEISAEVNIDTDSITKDLPEVVDHVKTAKADTETEPIDGCSSEKPKEIKGDNIRSSVVLRDEKNETQENSKLDENNSELFNPELPESNSEPIEMLDSNYETEELNEKESEIINNSNLNINIDLLHSDGNLSQNIDKGDQVLDDLNEKDGCGDEEVPRTIPSVCLQSAEGND